MTNEGTSSTFYALSQATTTRLNRLRQLLLEHNQAQTQAGEPRIPLSAMVSSIAVFLNAHPLQSLQVWDLDRLCERQEVVSAQTLLLYLEGIGGGWM